MPGTETQRGPVLRGRLVDPATVVLESGQTITGVRDSSTFCGHTYLTGWLAGVLYESRDGETWQDSGIRFRSA